MSGQFNKSCAVIALSLALLYSGVAWAMEACVQHGGHTDYAAAQDHHSHQVSLEHAHPHEEVPVIHCASVNAQIGHAVRVASTELRRSDNGAARHAVSFLYAPSAARKNALWLEAVFRKAFTPSLTNDLARHLFLSVLQI